MAFEKIFSHPDKNTIVRMLTQGQGVRKVAKYLKEKYPKDKKMYVSPVTLQKFRKEKLNIEGIALDAIKQAEKEKKEVKEEKKGDTQIRRLPAYKDAVKKAADIQVDIRKELSELIILIKSRIEALFDKAEADEATINEETNLQKYFPILGNVLDKWMKYIEKVADQTIETNINVTVIESQMAAIREAVRETFQEIDPEASLKFLENLSKRMDSLHYQQPTLSFNKIHKDTKVLNAKIKEDSEE